jgi:nucleoside-diphosphate-sugar epimerase
MELDQKTILITGGAGFIGSHLVERLLSERQKVICLDNFDPFYEPKIKQANLHTALSNPNFTLVEGDIRDMECLKKLFSENRIKKVVHLAARAGVRASIANPQLMAIHKFTWSSWLKLNTNHFDCLNMNVDLGLKEGFAYLPRINKRAKAY